MQQILVKCQPCALNSFRPGSSSNRKAYCFTKYRLPRPCWAWVELYILYGHAFNYLYILKSFGRIDDTHPNILI